MRPKRSTCIDFKIEQQGYSQIDTMMPMLLLLLLSLIHQGGSGVFSLATGEQAQRQTFLTRVLFPYHDGALIAQP